ncbi:YgaP family membrane protein [Aestuariirhabdus sp. LZHN29]|uniref:YgaP family membrane protein n=1 Tax=Aestuariirhabdus sp. LZHN29 TaxID=3417462 RepID=UPI003CECACEE
MSNVGTIDRVLRVIVGLALISLVFVGPQTPWGWVGLVPLLTGAISFCPLYRILGLSTCKTCES